MGDLVRQSLGWSLAERCGPPELIAESRKQSEAALEEILLPNQLKRIRQLAYQVEIAKLGLSESLTDGRLGKDIGVNDNQKQHLAEKAAAVEAENAPRPSPRFARRPKPNCSRNSLPNNAKPRKSCWANTFCSRSLALINEFAKI